MRKLHLLSLSFSLFPLLALTHGCAGELEGDPSRFLDGSTSATGAGGSPGAGGSGTGTGGGTAGTGGTMTAGCDQAVSYLTSTCGILGCHGGPSPQMGVDLMNVGNGQQYINAHPTGPCATFAPLIDPNNAQNSLLYLIVQDEPPRPCGFLMPFGMPSPIPQAQQTCILQWAQSVISGGGGGG
jgi:hypothetical protein